MKTLKRIGILFIWLILAFAVVPMAGVVDAVLRIGRYLLLIPREVWRCVVYVFKGGDPANKVLKQLESAKFPILEIKIKQ
jgi:hypothetical protein